VLHDKTFMTYIIASILLVSVEMNLTNYIGIRLGNLKQDIQWMPFVEAKISCIHMLGFLRTEYALAVVILSLFIGRLLKLRSDTKTMLIAMALNIIGYTYLTFGSQPMLLILLMLVATVGELTYVPIKQAFLVNIVPDDARSSYMAISGMVIRAALMLSGLNIIIGGFLSVGGMAVLIFLIGMTGLLFLASIIPSLQGAVTHPKSAETSSTK
jgi:DHA1 family multidrug resistance protein B-like MFS transporter